jgi:hypothetical protein
MLKIDPYGRLCEYNEKGEIANVKDCCQQCRMCHANCVAFFTYHKGGMIMFRCALLPAETQQPIEDMRVAK